ncbi:MAG: nuclear transport factor 2 family protein [Gemmatimonadales bacterium]
MKHGAIIQLLDREVDPAEYAEIRDLWKAHSIAEDNRDLDGLIATLTEDCVYELPHKGARWEGHDGAREFYTGLLGAIPDVDFRLQYIVIGPQGVCEEALAVGTFVKDWLDFRATGEPMEFRVVIFFPWDRERRKFGGETVYFGIEA